MLQLTPSDHDLKEWNEWVDSRPEVVQAIARKFPPWMTWRMKETGADYYRTRSIREDGTMTVFRFNAVDDSLMWIVFGVYPEDLLPFDNASSA